MAPPRALKAIAAQKKSTSKQKKSSWKGLKISDLKDLGAKIKKRFNWEHEPRDFQLEATKAQLLRKDVLIHAGTGSGKTAVVAGPHAHEGAEGMVTFLISPLIALQEEQVKTFEGEFKLTATAINSSRGGCSADIMKDVWSGKWQIVILSPEMMLSKRFISNVLRNPEMNRRVLSVVVDEAHVVSHWGSGFRKKYGTLGIVRALLPKGTPIVAMSATLPSRVRRDVITKLQFNEKDYTYLNLGNDRPNVSLVVRAMHHQMNSYADLDFLIPTGTKNISNIKKTWIYADNVTSGTEIVEHLYDIGPEEFREAGIIRNYNAALTAKGRTAIMEQFRAGLIRVLVCTDAAGMGCNIPDIDIVVQWKLPGTVSAFVQRAGRAARGTGRTGLAVLLVEKSAYNADLLKAVITKLRQPEVRNAKKKAGIHEAADYPKAENKQYAISRGILRGASSGKTDVIGLTFDVPIDLNAIDEGLYALVQTTFCRRRVLTSIYSNEMPNPVVPCCDICHPELLDLTRPAASSSKSRKSALKVGVPNRDVVKSIAAWRTEIWKRDFDDALFGPSAILSNESIEVLSSVGPINSLVELERALGGGWAWFGKYGNELLDTFLQLRVPPMQPKPRETKAAPAPKRAIESVDEAEVNKSKRRRTMVPSSSISTMAPTPVSVTFSQHAGPAPSPTPRLPAMPVQSSRPSQMGHYSHQFSPIHSSPLAGNPYAALSHLHFQHNWNPGYYHPSSYHYPYHPSHSPSPAIAQQHQVPSFPLSTPQKPSTRPDGPAPST